MERKLKHSYEPTDFHYDPMTIQSYSAWNRERIFVLCLLMTVS